MHVKTKAGMLFVLVAGAAAFAYADQTARRKGSMVKPPAALRAYVALEIRHLGAEDRPVPCLVLYPTGTPDADARFGCGRVASCEAIPAPAFAKLAATLKREFFQKPIYDANTQKMGSFAFRLLEASSQSVSSPELRCNQAHSAPFLRRASTLLPAGSARRAVQDRFALTRIK